MKTIDLPKGTISIFDDIKQMPINRFSEFQVYLIQNSGMGSTMEDYDRHNEKVDSFLAAGKLQEAIAERSNQRYNWFIMLSKINTSALCLACLVHSIDGNLVTDYSEENLIKVSNQIGKMGLTVSKLEEILEAVKKKSIQN